MQRAEIILLSLLVSLLLCTYLLSFFMFEISRSFVFPHMRLHHLVVGAEQKQSTSIVLLAQEYSLSIYFSLVHGFASDSAIPG